MVKRLLLLNGLAVLGAAINHSSGWGFTALFWWTDRYRPVSVPSFEQLGSVDYYLLRVMEQLIMFSIPAFLFVSGYFVAFATGRRQENIGFRTLLSRIRILIIPYLLWSILLFIWQGIQGQFDTPFGYFEQLALGQAAAPYYYVPLLIQFFVISPVIVPLVRRHGKWALLFAGAVQLTALVARYPQLLGQRVPLADFIVDWTPGVLIPQTLFWFVFGVFVGFNLAGLKDWLSRWRKALPGITLIAAVAGFLEFEVLFRLSGEAWLPPAVTPLDSLYSGGVILTFIAYEGSFVPFGRQFGELGTKSFGVYLVHAPVQEFVSRFLYHFSPWVLGHQLLFQPLLICCGIAVPLLLMTWVNRSRVRPYYQYIFG